MFNWYKDLIEKLFSTVFAQSGESVSFLDYLIVIGYSLLLILAFVMVLALLGGCVAGPIWGHRKLLGSVKEAICNFSEDATLEEFQKTRHKLWTRRILFWSLLLLVYIPIAIPTVLYILSLIARLFA